MVKKTYSPPSRPITPKNRQIREFKMQREHKKSSIFSKQINNFAPASHFLAHFFAGFFSFHADYHVKFPNLTFEGGRKQTRTNLSFSF